MKVLVISHMYPTDTDEVKGIFVHKQVVALINQGCEVKVVSPVPYVPKILSNTKESFRYYSQIPSKLTLDDVDVYYPRYIEFPKGLFFSQSGKLMYLGINKTIEKIYGEFKFDIIHSHVVIPDGYAAMHISKKYNVPYIVTVHGQDLQKTIILNKSCKNNLAKTFEDTDAIVAVSNKLKNVVNDEPFAKKISVIGNGISIGDIVKDESDHRRGAPFKILSASSLIKSKGIDINIIAISKIIKKFPNIEYTVIGQGPEKKRLIQLADKMGIADKVIFFNQLPHREVMKYMAETDLFCLPSWEEGFGVVYIEAMASGKPVIGVLGEGIEDAIENGKDGFLVKSKDSDDLADKLQYVISNYDKCIQMGKLAKEKVLSNYTWECNAKKIIHLYNQLL